MSTTTRNREYIPGLNMPRPLGKQVDTFGPLQEFPARKLKDFEISTLVKQTPLSEIHLGYDKALKECVSLVFYYPDEIVGDKWRETHILKNINDKHILEFFGIMYDSNIDREYLTFKSFDCFLSQLLSKEHQELFETPVIKCVISQLFTALKYLHDKDIVHRDITPSNLVLNEKGVLKISNFRNARMLRQCSKAVLTTDCRYQPIDVLLSSESVSTAEDIWSASCIFAEMMLKRKLFESMEKSQLIRDILSVLGFPREDIYKEFVELPDYRCLKMKKFHTFNCLGKFFENNQSLDLLKCGLIYNPMYRISADECLIHPYFAEDPIASSTKAFGVMLHGRSFNFPVNC